MSRFATPVLLVLLGWLAALAPVGAPFARAEIVVTDITGREVRLDKPAERILIDDGRYLVALALIHPDPVSVLTAWPKDIHRIGPEFYQAFARKFPEIEKFDTVASSAGNLSVEQVIAADADLALFSLSARPSPTQIAQIEAAGTPVAIIDFFNHPLENSAKGFRLLGAVVDREDQAEAFIAMRQERIDTIRERLDRDAAPRPQVLLEPHAGRTADCCASPGQGNIGDYVELVGGENIGAAIIPGIVGMLNLEYVIETDPDVYVATGGPHMEGTGGLLIGPGYDEETIRATLARVLERTGIATLSAVREGRAHGLAHQLINSPLDILAIEALARWIRPDLFADIDPAATQALLNRDFLAVPLEGTYWISVR